jgi:hypothetical protein
MHSSIANRIYETTSPLILLITGWFAIALGMAWRLHRGVEIPPFNLIFLVIGLMVYFLPSWLLGQATGEPLQRKLLWLLGFAGLLLFAAELSRPWLLPDQI